MARFQKPILKLPSDIDPTDSEWAFLTELLTEWFAHTRFLPTRLPAKEEKCSWSIRPDPEDSGYGTRHGHVYSIGLKFWQDGPSSKILELLPQIPEKLPYLTALTLQYDYLAELPDSFRQLTHLEGLSLGGKQLHIPDDFFETGFQFRNIFFSNMPMAHLPTSLAACPNFKYITLHLLPNLTTLPHWIITPELQGMSILACRTLTDLPDTFDRCPDFRKLVIKFCPGIATLPPTLRAILLNTFRCIGHLSHIKELSTFYAMSGASIDNFDIIGPRHYFWG
jgi:hypothetical protein